MNYTSTVLQAKNISVQFTTEKGCVQAVKGHLHRGTQRKNNCSKNPVKAAAVNLQQQWLLPVF